VSCLTMRPRGRVVLDRRRGPPNLHQRPTRQPRAIPQKRADTEGADSWHESPGPGLPEAGVVGTPVHEIPEPGLPVVEIRVGWVGLLGLGSSPLSCSTASSSTRFTSWSYPFSTPVTAPQHAAQHARGEGKGRGELEHPATAPARPTARQEGGHSRARRSQEHHARVTSQSMN